MCRCCLLKASNSKWGVWRTDGDRAGTLERTHVPSQRRKSPRSSDCISPLKCRPRPPPTSFEIFCCYFASFKCFIAVRLNKIHTFEMPQEKGWCGWKYKKIAFWEIHVLWIYFHFQLMYLIIFHTKITVRQNIL